MAEYSMLWQTGTTGDGAAAGYTEEQTRALFEGLFVYDNTEEGVSPAYGNRLSGTAVSGGSPKVTIGTGAALLKGLYYWSTAAKDLSLTKPSVGDTGFRVVLRGSGPTTRTLRLAVIMNSDGVAAIPALTQDAGFPGTASTTWEIPLFEGVVDTSGDIWTDAGKGTAGLTDDRGFLLGLSPTIYRRQGGDAVNWITAGTSDYLPVAPIIQCGVIHWTGSINYYGGVDLTFPVAFGGNPIVMANGLGDAITTFADPPLITTTGCKIWWKNALMNNITDLDIAWIAIGPAA